MSEDAGSEGSRSEGSRSDRRTQARSHRRAEREQRMRDRRKRNRRNAIGVGVVVVLIATIVAVFVGGKFFGGSDEFAGDGKADIVIQVHDGDSTTAIGQTLVDNKVIATVKGFVDAARSNGVISAIQPGFYKVRTEVPAASAVARLADPGSRVGKVVIPEGRQLDDVEAVGTGAVTQGIFALVSDASCVDLNGQRKCVAVADLRRAAEQETAAALNVPEWAVEAVAAQGNNHRRIEGLIAPGTWNVNPAGSGPEILSALIAESVTHYVNGGILDTAKAMNLSPYEILVVGSLVQREAKPHDFAKVARVIYNRLAEPQRLEFDSTVNYPLDRQEVATTDADRAQATPWNTYAAGGLPATPICSPGDDALAAAEHPEPGDWLYFVTVDLDGTTLFTHEYGEHLANIELARRNGVLDSAR